MALPLKRTYNPCKEKHVIVSQNGDQLELTTFKIF